MFQRLSTFHFTVERVSEGIAAYLSGFHQFHSRAEKIIGYRYSYLASLPEPLNNSGLRLCYKS